MISRRNRTVCFILFALAALAGGRLAAAFSVERDGRSAVFKVYVTSQRPDFGTPWQTRPPTGGTGTAFLIGKRRILTNAHLTADAKFIEIQRDGQPTRYRGEVLFSAHDCDLAVIEVKEEEFFRGTRVLELATELPRLNEEVTVVGYPMGGIRLSVTKGVVSRLDYGTYAHSAIDQHLVLQVDAAINPGNSGGPVLYKGRVVGAAFQGMAMGDNIGYAIPMPVIRHFLEDIDDGYYHGYPELGALTMELRNPALKKTFNLPPGRSGVVVMYLDPFGSAVHTLKAGDVLLSIDGHPIDDDGTITFDGNRNPFQEILERKQWGQTVAFNVWRNGLDVRMEVPLRNPPDPFQYRNLYDQRPEYFVIGGLVFSPLSREYLRTKPRRRREDSIHQLRYYSEYAKIDELYKGRCAFIVLIRRLPHEVNAYMEDFEDGILETVNGQPIGSLQDLKAAVERPQDGFHTMRFAGMDDTLVLDASAASAADPVIFAGYGVPAREFMRELPK